MIQVRAMTPFGQGLLAGLLNLEQTLTASFVVPEPDVIWRHPYEFVGNNKRAWECLDPVVLLAGPAETGKTLTLLCLVHYLCVLESNLRCVIARATRESLWGTTIATFVDKVLPRLEDPNVPDKPDQRVYLGRFNNQLFSVTSYGGTHPGFFKYSNKSSILAVGLDKSARHLGGEFDIIFVSQAEQLKHTDETSDVELLTTRVTGRAGNLKSRPAQLLMDCNPGGQNHFLLQMERSGLLTKFDARHEDNPSLYNRRTGEWTPQGLETNKRLSRLSGVRRKRLYKGEWVGAEGLIFETFDPAVHGWVFPNGIFGDGAPNEDTEDINDEGVLAPTRTLPELIQNCSRLWLSLDYGYGHANVFMLHGELVYNEELVFVTLKVWKHTQHRPKEIAPDVINGLARLGTSINETEYTFAGADCFFDLGVSEQNIEDQYEALGIRLTRGVFGPGSRVLKVHWMHDLLGSEKRAPRWYYVRETCQAVETSLSTRIADPRNAEDVLKDSTDEDDVWDSLMLGLYQPAVSHIG